jgi:hypothetical protein
VKTPLADPGGRRAPAEVPEVRPAEGGLRPSHAWRWFLLFEALVGLFYFPIGFPSGSPRILGVVPWMEWPGQVPAWAVLGLSSVAAIFYGARRYRPDARVAWWLLGVGLLLFISGDTIYKSWHQLIGDQHIPFPSFIEGFYVAMYAAVGVGLMLLNRARVRGSDRSSLLDALIVTLGMARSRGSS